LSGKLTAGKRLASEEKLCERFQVSRTVVREAIQQLRSRGMLRTTKGSGTYIAKVSLETLGTAVKTYTMLASDANFLELIDFRILIESECARLAAINAGEQFLCDLREVIDEMEGARSSRAKFSKTDITFHLLIAKASGNNIYTTLLEAVEKRCVDYANFNRGNDDWHLQVIDDHRSILAAIEAARPDLASSEMRDHLLSSRRHFVDLSI